LFILFIDPHPESDTISQEKHSLKKMKQPCGLNAGQHGAVPRHLHVRVAKTLLDTQNVKSDRCLAEEAEKPKADEKNRKPTEKKREKMAKAKRAGKGAGVAAKKEPGRAVIARLRLADNAIDGFHVSSSNNREALIEFLQLCTQ